MPNYGVPPVALARGQGSRVWDVDGREYLDLIAGIAVSSLGHAHPAVIEAVSSQVASIAHTSNLFMHEREVELAERLLGLLGAEGRVFFSNSGTEANEAAFKLTRRYGASRGSARTYVVAAEGGFHGRTMGALALTGKAQIREPFGPYGVDVTFVPYGDAAALRAAVTGECAAVFLEPALGEGGVVPPPDGYLRAAREACDATGAVLVLDEIQSGIGRTGRWFAHQWEGITPDVLTLAKGLGGGLPIGACIGLGRFGSVLGKGDHGSTFGGNPVACAAALAVLDVIERDDLLARAAEIRGPAQVGDRRHRAPAARRGPRPRPMARRRADQPGRGRSGARLPGGRFPGQRRAAGRGADRAAPCSQRRGSAVIPRRVPRRPRRRGWRRGARRAARRGAPEGGHCG